MLPPYRIYFQDAGTIVGREDFEAEDDAIALVIAGLLFDACSDVCDGFELWHSTRRVDTSFSQQAKALGRDLSDQRQAAVARTEEQLCDSRWAIASSKRLLARVQQLTSAVNKVR